MNKIIGKTVMSFIVFIAIISTFSSCKDDYTSIVPYVHVDMNINPTNFIEFNIPGGSYYFSGQGYGGIIIFRDLSDGINFIAYDATCTNEVSSACRVIADGSGLATCKCCGSQFILFGGNGSPIKGPAIEPLKQYRTSYAGGRIIVRN